MKNELSLAFGFKRISKSIPVVFVVLMVDLVPKTEPTMAATMNTVVSKLIGMMNLFF